MVSFGGNATDGYTVTGLKAGQATITATQPGQAPWNSATASQTLIVIKANQSIVRNDGNATLPDLTVDKGECSITPEIKTVSTGGVDTGLPVNYSSSDTSVVAINGTRLQPIGPGTATITASQAGIPLIWLQCPRPSLLR